MGVPPSRYRTNFLRVCRPSGDGLLSFTLTVAIRCNMVVTMKNCQIYNWNRNSTSKEPVCHPLGTKYMFGCMSG